MMAMMMFAAGAEAGCFETRAGKTICYDDPPVHKPCNPYSHLGCEPSPVQYIYQQGKKILCLGDSKDLQFEYLVTTYAGPQHTQEKNQCELFLCFRRTGKMSLKTLWKHSTNVDFRRLSKNSQLHP